MILSVEELMKNSDFKNQDVDSLVMKLIAVETLIRKYTNNNFQNRNIRFLADSYEGRLNGTSPFIREGDTIQISESKVNDGLYIVTKVNEDHILVDRPLFPVANNLVTKIEYPVDLKAGVMNLMSWEVNNRKKVGIKQETISRHSVTYYDQDSNNQVMGYPASLLGFLEPYKKARF